MVVNWDRLFTGEDVDGQIDELASEPDSIGELDKIAHRMALELVTRTGVRDPARWVAPLRRRWGWGFEPETLARIGDSLGLTRERVRQMMLAAESFRDPNPRPIPEALIDAIELIDWDEPADVTELLIDSGLSSPESRWSADGILKLLSAYGREGLSLELERRMAEGERQAIVSDEVKRAVRQTRHKSGFLDVRAVCLEGQTLPADKVLAATRQVYPRVAVVGPWLLCSTQKATTVENAAIVQLKIAGNLTGDEIFEGNWEGAAKAPFRPPSTSDSPGRISRS